MQSNGIYYLQMCLTYLNVVLQCFFYLGVGILAFRAAGPLIRACKVYTASAAATPQVLPATEQDAPPVSAPSPENTAE